jgi:hypothetical protein
MIVPIAVAPALLVQPAALLDILAPVTESSVAVDVVDLGVVSPAEEVTAEARIRNVSWRGIPLSAPQSDCGCATIQQSPQFLPAGDEARIGVRLAAPGSPGEFTRSITFGALGTNIKWIGIFRGEVDADVWAEPSRVDMRANFGETAEADIAIGHRDDVSLVRVAASSPTLNIVSERPIKGGTMIRVRAPAVDQPSLKQTIDVFTTGDASSPRLRVPVNCQADPPFTCVPSQLDMGELGIEPADWFETAVVKQTVAVMLRPGVLPDDIQIEAMCAYINAVKSVVNEATLRIELSMDVSEMSDVSNATLLRVKAKQRNYAWDLRAVRSNINRLGSARSTQE